MEISALSSHCGDRYLDFGRIYRTWLQVCCCRTSCNLWWDWRKRRRYGLSARAADHEHALHCSKRCSLSAQLFNALREHSVVAGEVLSQCVISSPCCECCSARLVTTSRSPEACACTVTSWIFCLRKSLFPSETLLLQNSARTDDCSTVRIRSRSWRTLDLHVALAARLHRRRCLNLCENDGTFVDALQLRLRLLACMFTIENRSKNDTM